MIKSFKHKGLELLFIQNIKSKLDSRDIKKINRILDRLDVSVEVKDMNIPGWNLHELKGVRKGVWSVSVRQNWRITFRFVQANAFDVSLEDYH